MKLYYQTWPDDLDEIMANGFEDRSMEGDDTLADVGPSGHVCEDGVLVWASPKGNLEEGWRWIEVTVAESSEDLERYLLAPRPCWEPRYWLPAKILCAGSPHVL